MKVSQSCANPDCLPEAKRNPIALRGNEADTEISFLSVKVKTFRLQAGFD